MHLSSPGAQPINDRQIAWMLAFQGTFIVSGVLFALMDRLAGERHG